MGNSGSSGSHLIVDYFAGSVFMLAACYALVTLIYAFRGGALRTALLFFIVTCLRGIVLVLEGTGTTDQHKCADAAPIWTGIAAFYADTLLYIAVERLVNEQQLPRNHRDSTFWFNVMCLTAAAVLNFFVALAQTADDLHWTLSSSWQTLLLAGPLVLTLAVVFITFKRALGSTAERHTAGMSVVGTVTIGIVGRLVLDAVVLLGLVDTPTTAQCDTTPLQNPWLRMAFVHALELCFVIAPIAALLQVVVFRATDDQLVGRVRWSVAVYGMALVVCLIGFAYRAVYYGRAEHNWLRHDDWLSVCFGFARVCASILTLYTIFALLTGVRLVSQALYGRVFGSSLAAADTSLRGLHTKRWIFRAVLLVLTLHVGGHVGCVIRLGDIKMEDNGTAVWHGSGGHFTDTPAVYRSGTALASSLSFVTGAIMTVALLLMAILGFAVNEEDDGAGCIGRKLVACKNAMWPSRFAFFNIKGTLAAVFVFCYFFHGSNREFNTPPYNARAVALAVGAMALFYLHMMISYPDETFEVSVVQFPYREGHIYVCQLERPNSLLRRLRGGQFVHVDNPFSTISRHPFSAVMVPPPYACELHIDVPNPDETMGVGRYLEDHTAQVRTATVQLHVSGPFSERLTAGWLSLRGEATHIVLVGHNSGTAPVLGLYHDIMANATMLALHQIVLVLMISATGHGGQGVTAANGTAYPATYLAHVLENVGAAMALHTANLAQTHVTIRIFATDAANGQTMCNNFADTIGHRWVHDDNVDGQPATVDGQWFVINFRFKRNNAPAVDSIRLQMVFGAYTHNHQYVFQRHRYPPLRPCRAGDPPDVTRFFCGKPKHQRLLPPLEWANAANGEVQNVRSVNETF